MKIFTLIIILIFGAFFQSRAQANTTLNICNDTVTIIDTACGSYSWIATGLTYTSSGIYVDTLTNQANCDSIVTLDLTILPAFFSQASATICQGDSVLLPNGTYAFSQGSYTTNFSTVNACDSTIETMVFVLPTYFAQASSSICQGDSALLPDGTFAFTQGSYTLNFQSNAGCDSVVSFQLEVLPTYFNQASATICQGDSVLLPDGIYVFAQGSYTTQLSSVNGCDSTIQTDVFVNPLSLSQDAASICMGDTLLLPDGQFVFAQGSYTIQLSNQFGCDSVVEFFITVNDTFLTTQNQTICDNETFLLPNGQSVNAAGTYDVALSSASGCDSTIRVNLSIIPAFIDTIRASICSGSTYQLPNGQIVNASGNYSSVFSSANDCDSTIVVSLNVIPNSNNTMNVSICQGENYTLPSGVVVSTSGQYLSNFQTINGCDSNITTNLTINPLNVAFISRTLVPGESVVVRGQTYTEPGLYIDTLNVTGPNGCDSVLRITISRGVGIGLNSKTSQLTIYPNPNNGQFQIEYHGNNFGKANLNLFDINGKLVHSQQFNECKLSCTQTLNVPQLPSGIYILQLQNGRSIETMRLQISK